MANVEWASDSESSNNDEITTLVNDDPRSLSADEINTIINGLRFGLKHNPIQENIIHIHREKTRRKLATIKIRPSKIADLKKIIHQQFYKSVIAPGEAIGVNAAQCIGEPTTQMSTLGTERVLVYNKTNGEYYNGPIGDFIDEFFTNDNASIIDLGGGSLARHFDSDDEYCVLTVDPDTEKCAWRPLSEVSRHPANGGMIRVTTETGRKVTTTLSHSHLQRTAEGKIIPIVGSDLHVGDRIPVASSVEIPAEDRIRVAILPNMVRLNLNTIGWDIGLFLAGPATSADIEKNSILQEFLNADGIKYIPGWVFFAQKQLIADILYSFIGHECLEDMRTCSMVINVNKYNRVLLEDIANLLTQFNILAVFKGDELQQFIIEHQYMKIFMKEIGCSTSLQEDNVYQFIHKPCDSLISVEQRPNKDANVIWDKIVKIDYLDDPQTLVYDFGVNGNHTFSVNAGVFIHNTLNSVAPWEKIFYQTADGDLKLVTIGEWIDSLMETNADKIKNVPENNTQYLELDEPVWTPSSNDQGVMTWEALTAVTKHLPCGDLVRVKTRSGREATVTRSKSLLVWDHDLSRFVEKGGADVVIGDLLPVICDFPEPNVIKTHVNLRDYLSPKEWVYGSELLALYRDWSADNRPKRNGFWCGKDRLANLPYSRSDAAIESARLNCVQEGCVYPKKNITSVKSRIPEQFPLDQEFGTIVGLYLAEGWATDTFVGISNNDPSIQKLLEAWCDKYGITHHTVVTRSERFENGKSTDLKIHSVLLARWFKKWIGTGSANKRMPIESFVAPESFVIGVLDGYFAGDGTVNKKDGSLIIGSASEELIIGYGVLCTRLSILGRKAGHQVKKNNIGSKNIKYTHTYAIRNGWAQRWANIIGSCHPDKHNLMHEITLQKKYKNEYSSYWDKQENVILDPIVKLENVPATEWVYDLTIPTTTNFCLWNGLAINDTFHSAGISAKNVTLGFPRATELFNATHTPANPTCTVYFNRDNKTLKDFHKVTDKIQEAIIDDLLKKTPTECGWECFDPEEYTYEYWHIAWFKLNANEPLGEDEWCLRLHFDIGKLYSRNLTIQEIAKEIKTSYSDVRVIPSPLNLGIVDIIVNCAEINIVSERSKDLDDIEDLYEERRFYMQKIVSPKIRGQLICGVQGITNIYRRKAKSNESFGGLALKPELASRLAGSDEEWIIDTDGTNLPAILALPGVDPYRTLSNDMWEIFSMLGIEAARNYLFIEFMNIVNSGGTSINPVHIETLVGKMTYTGSIRAIARFGVETSQYDPIARATFEEVMSQLVTSAMFSECDHLSGISSNIVLGTKIRAGTGTVNIEDIPLKIIPHKTLIQKMPKIRPPSQSQIQEEDDIITEDI